MRTPWYHLPNKMIPDEIETDMNLLHKKRKGESFLGKKKMPAETRNVNRSCFYRQMHGNHFFSKCSDGAISFGSSSF
jgi:hypothetical protein